jgi:pyridoxine 4-dehydrogenase
LSTPTTSAALPTFPSSTTNTPRVSTLGLGTWSWGNRFLYNYDTSQDESIAEAFKEAARAGVTLFDSADSYGTGDLSGRAESLLGSFLNDRSLCSSSYRQSQVVAATKIAPYPWRVTGKMFERAARASVARMSGKSSDDDDSETFSTLPPSRVVIQLHWSAANYAPPQEAALWDGLLRCYDSGLCSAVGVSNFGPRQLAKISRFLEKNGVPLAVAQTQYSLLSCGSETEAAISASRDAGAVPLAYSPLALGMLSGRYSVSNSSSSSSSSSSKSKNDSGERKAANLPKGPRSVLFKKVLPGARGLLEVIDAVAAETKVSSSSSPASGGGVLETLLSPFAAASTTKTTTATPAQVAIAWCVAKRTVPIPGARTASDVRSHVAAATMRLPAGAVEELDAAARAVRGGMTKNVFVTK